MEMINTARIIENAGLWVVAGFAHDLAIGRELRAVHHADQSGEFQIGSRAA